MALLWLLVIVMSCLNCCWANEPYCRQYEYDEKMLSKMIRTEIAMETLTKKLESMETDMMKRMAVIEKQNADENVQAASIGGPLPLIPSLLVLSGNGRWTDWSDWTECTSSCGGGIQSRYRSCDKPARYLNGKMCDGPPTEYRACSEQPCDGEKSLAARGMVPNRVVFTVTHPSSSLKNGALQFSTVLTNYGEDFNNDTGRFVCDVPGLYHFAATIMCNTATANQCYCYIYVGSTSKVLVLAHTKHTGDYPSGSGSLVYELTTGDEVYLGNCYNYKHFYPSTHFSGLLIQ